MLNHSTGSFWFVLFVITNFLWKGIIVCPIHWLKMRFCKNSFEQWIGQMVCLDSPVCGHICVECKNCIKWVFNNTPGECLFQCHPISVLQQNPVEIEKCVHQNQELVRKAVQKNLFPTPHPGIGDCSIQDHISNVCSGFCFSKRLSQLAWFFSRRFSRRFFHVCSFLATAFLIRLFHFSSFFLEIFFFISARLFHLLFFFDIRALRDRF